MSKTRAQQTWDHVNRSQREFVAKSQTCHCHGCTRVATRFVGSKKHGWLRFCSVPEHKEAAFAYNEYLRLHPNAR